MLQRAAVHCMRARTIRGGSSRFPMSAAAAQPARPRCGPAIFVCLFVCLFVCVCVCVCLFVCLPMRARLSVGLFPLGHFGDTAAAVLCWRAGAVGTRFEAVQKRRRVDEAEHTAQPDLYGNAI